MLQKSTIQSTIVCGASPSRKSRKTLARRAGAGSVCNALLSGRNKMSSGINIIGNTPPKTKMASQPKVVTNCFEMKPRAVLPTATCRQLGHQSAGWSVLCGDAIAQLS